MVLSMDQIELFNLILEIIIVKQQYSKPFNYVQTNNWYWIELLVLDRNTWNYVTLCKEMSSGSFENNVIAKLFDSLLMNIVQILFV